jgi:hypothetical protein
MATSSSGGGIDYCSIFFANPNLTPIQGEPDADALITLKNQLKANASSVPSNLGGGNHGHLGLVLSPATYALVSNTPFVTPAHPGVLAIPNGTTAAMSTVLKDQHTERMRLFREVTGVEKALKQQIIKALDKEWLLAIADHNTQSLSGTVAQILEHLFETYGYVSQAMLEKKEEALKNLDYHPRHPVDLVFNAVEDLADYADMATTGAFTQTQIIGKAYSQFNRTGLLSQAITEWNRKPDVQKTWITFKTHFRQARKELKESSGATIENSDLNQTANLVQQVVDGVQQALLPPNGATDATSEILQQVVNSASTTTSTQQQLIQQLAQLQQSVTQMQFQLNTQQPQQQSYGDRGNSGGRGGCGGRGRGNGGYNRVRYPRRYNLYCWSHGGCGHRGERCRSEQNGHQDNATFENKMGGSTINCPPGNVAPAPGWTPPNANGNANGNANANA